MALAELVLATARKAADNKGLEDPTITATYFRTHCMRLMDEVAATGKSILITKRGRPVARLVPIEPVRKPLGGRWEGRIRTKGDIVHFDTSSEWDALK